MKYLTIILISLVTAFSCNQKSNFAGDSSSKTTAENIETCYEAVSDSDTVKLSVIMNGQNITGSLVSETSSSNTPSGTFAGTKSGDTLKVNLRYVTSGKILFKEIYLLQKNNQLYQATGDERQINDSTYLYTLPSALIYSQNLIFQQIDCPKF